MSTVIFCLGFSLLIAHEMDAIAQSEWQLLYIFRKLPERIAAPLFVAVHVPLFAFLLWLSIYPSSSIQQVSRLAIALFLIIHAILHKRLDRHPHYTFHSTLSKSLIYGGGLVGFLYCTVSLMPY
ncbi:MAG: DUF6713 family protein [Cyanobacteria bacterium J06632_3]